MVFNQTLKPFATESSQGRPASGGLDDRTGKIYSNPEIRSQVTKGARGASDPKNEAQGSPQTPKMDPKRCPETPKWCPSDPPSSQNGAQEAPGQAPEMCARSLHDRTNIQTNAKITTQQAATQTRKIKRPGGMREAIK